MSPLKFFRGSFFPHPAPKKTERSDKVYMTVILKLGGLRQGDLKFQDNLNYILKSALIKNKDRRLGMVVHAFSSPTLETEAGGFRPACST